MATLTVTPITRAGVVVTTLTAAAVGGDVYPNASSPYLEFLNSSGADITVYAAVYVDGQTIVQGRAWVIAAGARVRILPNGSSYTHPSTGMVSLTYSGVTTFSVGVFSH
jgi:hypothetical protein